MKYAVVGTGYWGSNHVRVAAELAEEGILDSVLICDIDEERARNLAERHDVDYTTDRREILRSDVEAATVATPSPTHESIGTELLTAGIDVLVEKPLALTSEAAWNLQRTAEEQNQMLAVGHIFRYHPALQELKRRIDRGELGRIKYLKTNRSSFRVPRRTAGALYSLAVHDIDIYRMLLDCSPDQIYCRLDKHVRNDVDETVSVVQDYGGVTGLINASWQIPVFDKRRDLIVVGTEKVAYIDYLKDTELQLFDARIVEDNGDFRAVQNGATTYTAADREPLKAEVEDFLHASQTGASPRATGRVGAETVGLLELAERSNEKGSVVPVSQEPEIGSATEA